MEDFEKELLEYVKTAISVMEEFFKEFSKGKLIKLMAKITRKYYEALIKEGFNKAEALQIVSRLPVSEMMPRIKE